MYTYYKVTENLVKEVEDYLVSVDKVDYADKIVILSNCGERTCDATKYTPYVPSLLEDLGSPTIAQVEEILNYLREEDYWFKFDNIIEWLQDWVNNLWDYAEDNGFEFCNL